MWRGLDPLQAQLLRQCLLDNGIECYLDRDSRRLDLGMTDVGLWVAKRDAAQARQIIAALEAELRAQRHTASESEPRT